MKILHFSDLHLDAPYLELSIPSKRKIREHVQSVFNALIRDALKPEIEGVLFVGDVFDHSKTSIQWLFRVQGAFKSLLEAGKFVVYATGNHDYWINKNHFKELEDYEHFILLSGDQVETRQFQLRGRLVAIHGLGYSCEQPQLKEGLLQKFPLPIADCFNIGVIHGVVTGQNTLGEANYYPMSKSALDALNYQYIGLGHVHTYQQVTENCAYPGQLLPLNFNDSQVGAGIKVTFNNDLLSIEPIRYPGLRLIRIALTVEAETKEALESQITGLLYPLKLECEEAIYRFVIEGNVYFDLEYDFFELLLERIFEEDSQCHQMIFRGQVTLPKKTIELPNLMRDALSKEWDKILSEDWSKEQMAFLGHASLVKEHIIEHSEPLKHKLLDLFNKEV